MIHRLIRIYLLVTLSGFFLTACQNSEEGDGPKGPKDTLIPWCDSRACDSLVLRTIYDSNGMTEERVDFGETQRKTWLDLSGIRVLPREIGRLKHLEYLSLNGTQLISLPPEIGQLPVLEDLWIDLTGLESLPETIGNLTSLQTLVVRRSRLKFIPESIGRLQRLDYLDVDGNDLESLPLTLGDLKRVTFFTANSNRLVSLPESFGDMSLLEQARLNENALTGLPASIGRLSRVWALDLEFNQLEALPESIGEMGNLTDLGLRSNRLTTLPRGLMNRSLDYLSVTQNRLCGLDADMSAWLDTLDWNWKDHQECP